MDKTDTILADGIFKRIFLNEKFCILIQIAPKFVPKGPIDNNPALVPVIWTNADQIHWRVHAVLVADELIWPIRQSRFNIFKQSILMALRSLN